MNPVAQTLSSITLGPPSEVWADIAAKSERLAASSSSGAMEEMFTVHAGFADRCVDSLLPIERQCGALFLIDGRVVGFDLFDRAVTLRRLLAKLVRSVAVDALDDSDAGRCCSRDGSEDGADAAPLPVRKADRRKSRRTAHSASVQTKVAEHFLERTCAADIHEAPAMGLGRDLRLTSREISGAALSVESSLLHLSAFHI